MKNQTKKDFLMSREFIAVLAAVVALINGLNIIYSIQNKNVTIFMRLILIILMYLTYFRWKIEPALSLIKKYKSLMIYIGELSRIDSTSGQIILGNT